MQLFYFLLVIISLSCGSLPPGEIDPLFSCLATVAMVGMWSLLCHFGGRVVARQVRSDDLDALAGARWLERQLEAFRWLSMGVVVLCLWGFGLAPVLDAVPMLANSMFLQAIILLAPGLIMVAATWSAEHDYGVCMDYCEPGIGGYLRAIVSAFRSGLAWLVVPVVLLMGLVDLIGLLPIHSEAAGIVAIGFAIIAIPTMIPTMIRHLFPTSTINVETSRWIESITLAAGVGSMTALRWETGGRAYNAVVAGFLRRFRTLLVSDRLLDELPREQIAMVLLHEAAHLRRNHLPLRMLAVLPAWIIGTLVTKTLGDVSWAVVIGSGVGILTTLVILRIVAYRTEFDADIQACKLAERIHEQCDDIPNTYRAASEALSSALLRVTIDHPESRRATWLHPSVEDRARWMLRHRAAPIISTNSAGTIANPA